MPEDEKEEPTAVQEEDEEMQEEPMDTTGTPAESTSGRGEKRTETRVREETSDDEITEATGHTCFTS